MKTKNRSVMLPFLSIAFLNSIIDIGHKIIVQNTIFKFYSGSTQIILTAIINALILLPFIVMFMPSAFLSDKFAKDKIIKWSSFLAIPITVLITISYYNGWFEFAFILTLLLAAQSAIYSPAKYGYLKEISNRSLTVGNSYLQAVTIVAILFSNIIFSVMFEKLFPADFTSINGIIEGIAPLGLILIALSVFEFLSSFRLTKLMPADPCKKIKKSDFNFVRKAWKDVRSHKMILTSVLILSFYWAISQLILAIFPSYLKDNLNETNTVINNLLMGMAGIGTVIGSILYGRNNKESIGTLSIPFAMATLAISILSIPLMNSVYGIGASFLLYGIASGYLVVPLNSLIQFHAKKEKLGEVLAANNLMQNITMVLFLGINILILFFQNKGDNTMNFNSEYLFYILSALVFAGSLIVANSFKRDIVEFLVTAPIKLLFKIKGEHKELDKSKGNLILANHPSYVDFILIYLFMKTDIEFVVSRYYYEKWYFKPIMKLFDAIPISQNSSKDALRKMTELLNDGKTVLVFPGGAITRNGQMLELMKGMNLIMNNTDAHRNIVYLHGTYDSMFGFGGKKNWYRKLQFRKEVHMELVVKADVSDVEDVRKVLERSAVKVWDRMANEKENLLTSIVTQMKKAPFKTSVVNYDGKELSRIKTLAVAKEISKNFKRYDGQIGTILPTSAASSLLMISNMILGKTLINLNYTSPLKALESGIERSEISTIITSKQFIHKLQSKGFYLEDFLSTYDTLYVEDLVKNLDKKAVLKNIISMLFKPVRSIIKDFKQINNDDTLAVLFSSGSEGMPKGIELSQKNIRTNIEQIDELLSSKREEVILSSLPTFHAFGLTVTSLYPLVKGIKMVCVPDPTDAGLISKMVREYNVSVMFATNSLLNIYNMSKKVKAEDLASLNLVVAGAEKLLDSTRNAFMDKFNKAVYEGYGATETAPVAGVDIPQNMNILDNKYKENTIGYSLPGTSFMIVDPSTMNELDNGEEGLICISGPNVMKSYLGDPQKTADVIFEKDGLRWYKTGDKGMLSEDGRLKIIDRYSRFAKIGGEMISLTAVEEQVLKLIGEENIEVAAISIPDKMKGEKILLYVSQLGYKIDELKLQIRDAIHPLYQPKNIFSLEEIPKLGTGKKDFNQLKQMAMA